MIYQHSLPFCIRCGELHSRFLDRTYSQYCQTCEDRAIVEAFFARRKALGKTDEEILRVIHHKRPDLFERGVLPSYWTELLG